MPGRSSNSVPLQYVGLAVAIVAVVGSVGLGWEWGDVSDPLPIAIAAVAVVLAVGATLYSRLASDG